MDYFSKRPTLQLAAASLVYWMLLAPELPISFVVNFLGKGDPWVRLYDEADVAMAMGGEHAVSSREDLERLGGQLYGTQWLTDVERSLRGFMFRFSKAGVRSLFK